MPQIYKFIAGGNLAIIDDDGVSRSSCSIYHPPYLEWLALGNVPLPRDPQEVADEAAADAKAVKNTADATAAKGDAKLRALANMTPAQARAWINANVTNLAEAKDALGTLAAAVVVLARRL